MTINSKASTLPLTSLYNVFTLLFSSSEDLALKYPIICEATIFLGETTLSTPILSINEDKEVLLGD